MTKLSPADAQSPATHYYEICQFIYRELDLLDRRAWHDWLDLFTDDGVYWAPATPDQVDGINHVSLVFDDALLRKVRVARYETPYAFSLQPFPRSSHLVSNIMLDEASGAGARVRARFLMTEYQREAPNFYAGSYSYELVAFEGHYKIKMKKAELINCDGPLPSSHIYF